MTRIADVDGMKNYVPYLDHGFVGFVGHMGSDADIDQAARCSYGEGTRSVSDQRALIRYLVRNQHTSPIEMVELKFHLKMPIFIMRQHVRHRTASLNEYSGRYSEMTDEMYMPERARFQGQSKDNKQASSGILGDAEMETCQQNLLESFVVSYDNYQTSLENGLSRELARIQLPLANYTELYWKIDLKNFLHYTKLRNHPHAQYEIRVLAQLMYDFVKPVCPITCEAFEDYSMNASNFSRMEIQLLKRILSPERTMHLWDDYRGDKGVAESFGMSAKELKEFKEKLDILL